MRLFSKSNVVTITIVAVVAVAAGSGGAVAGALITGAQIKDGTVASVDLKNDSVTTTDMTIATRRLFRTIGKPTIVSTSEQDVAPGSTGSIQATCPAGTVGVSGSGGWFNGAAAVIYPDATAKNWYAYGENTQGTTDSLYLTVICLKVS
ncbi:MAG: hypothetical protein NTX33_02990 [Propionibacteriales bacterium]|nr:hypothetical protein [Propionibacteriales bacterium]